MGWCDPEIRRPHGLKFTVAFLMAFSCGKSELHCRMRVGFVASATRVARGRGSGAFRLTRVAARMAGSRSCRAYANQAAATALEGTLP